MAEFGSIDNLSPRFEVGETVECDVNFGGKIITACKIMAVLPPRDGEVQYRVKTEGEAFERMVAEYQLVNPH